MTFEAIMSEASQILGLPLPNMTEGAIRILDQNNREWLVDCPAGSEQLRVSCDLPNIMLVEENLERSLMLNGDRRRMGMSWLALEKSRLILGASVPLTLLTGRQFSNLMEHMYCLVGNIESEFIC